MDFFELNIKALGWFLLFVKIYLNREDIQMFSWHTHRWRMRFVDARIKARALRREGLRHKDIIRIIRKEFGWLQAFSTARKRKKAYYK